MTKKLLRKRRNFVLLKSLSIVLTLFLFAGKAFAVVERESFSSGGNYLVVEFLDDDLVHFELSSVGAAPSLSNPLYTSPTIKKTDYSGPSTYSKTGSTMETSDIRVVVNTSTLAVTVIDKTKSDLVLTTFSPKNLTATWKGLDITPESFTHAYGLGQKFYDQNQANGDLVGRIRNAGPFGNVMAGWDGGATGNTQFPIVYFAGSGNNSYGLFMDNNYKQEWNFTGNPWTAEMWGDWLRWYVMTGEDLQDIRKDYMELTGTPPMPPKQAFGMWLSEYGYDNWSEMDSKINTLKSNQFPLDGIVLDLQWFGGITGDDNTQMGSLTWDTVNFTNPVGKIADLKNNEGIGIVAIEESYIGKNLQSHTDLANQGYLAKDGSGNPIYLTSNPWWGKGGYIDWTNPNAGSFWHNNKREALINDGIIGHWTDLGEPEMYDSSALYHGVQGDYNPMDGHADVHNLYNLYWSESIYDGYKANSRTERPWILSRSGTSGSQRYGVFMWSGDIGGNLSSLNTHLNAQMHMSMSGLDYYGADIGGFHRQGMSESMLNEMYTVWFAHATLLDVPVRPHVENLCNCKEAAPDRIGDLQTNLENLRFRYELTPYYYSLAHRAYQFGEPLFPPMVYYFQSDSNVHEMGDQKMIGENLMVKTAAAHGVTSTSVYLPAGTWINYRTHTWHDTTGTTLSGVATTENGKFKLPLFARSGAIFPQAFVDNQTANVLGKRRDGSTRSELIVKVFADTTASDFMLYEDEGKNVSYESGDIRTTLISQQQVNDDVTVTIAAASGTYSGAVSSRANVVKLVVNNAEAASVTLNGSALAQHTTQSAFDVANSGWFNAGSNLIYAKSGDLSVTTAKTFVFTLTDVTSFASNYPAGSVLRLTGLEFSNWDPANSLYMMTLVANNTWETNEFSVPSALTNTPYKITHNGTWDVNWGGGAFGTTATLARTGSDATVSLNASNYKLRVTEGSDLNAAIQVEWIETNGTPVLTVNPSSLDFGVLAANVTANSDLTLSNVGGGTLQVQSITVSDSWLSTVQNGMTVTVTVDTTGLADGNYNGSVTINSNGGNQVIPVSVTVSTSSTVSVQFSCHNGNTYWGQSVYVVGSISELGNWDVASLDNNIHKLNPAPYPTWSGTIDLPPNTNIDWKCVKREEQNTSAGIEWQSGNNNNFTTPSSGNTSVSASF